MTSLIATTSTCCRVSSFEPAWQGKRSSRSLTLTSTYEDVRLGVRGVTHLVPSLELHVPLATVFISWSISSFGGRLRAGSLMLVESLSSHTYASHRWILRWGCGFRTQNSEKNMIGRTWSSREPFVNERPVRRLDISSVGATSVFSMFGELKWGWGEND